jgi:small subunit ribosomal protein S6
VPANVYEGMFILDTNRFARDQAGVSGQIPEMIEKLEGEMLASRLWEERRLAYPIDGHRKGTYWLTYFKIDSSKISDLTRQCQLSDSILRSLFLKVDPRISDALVSHALTGTQRRAPEPAAVGAGAGRDNRERGERERANRSESSEAKVSDDSAVDDDSK